MTITTLTPKQAVILLRSLGTVAKSNGLYRVNLIHGGASGWMTESEFLAFADRELAPAAPVPAALSSKMQHIARDYLDARKRAGVVLLDAARFLAEARATAKHGEWAIFLETTNTSEDVAEGLLRIAETAERNPRFAEAVRGGQLTQTVAMLYTRDSTPEAARERLLEAPAPPTTSEARTIIRDEQPPKIRIDTENAITSGADEPSDEEFNETAAEFAALGWRLSRNDRGHYVMLPPGRTVGIADPSWPHVVEKLRAFESAAARDLGQVPMPADLYAAGYRWSHPGAGMLAITGADGWQGDAPTPEGMLRLARDRVVAQQHAAAMPPAPAQRRICPTCGAPITNGLWGELEECGSCYQARGLANSNTAIGAPLRRPKRPIDQGVSAILEYQRQLEAYVIRLEQQLPRTPQAALKLASDLAGDDLTALADQLDDATYEALAAYRREREPVPTPPDIASEVGT